MGRLWAIEIVYRGIFQKTLAKNISRGIVLAARKEGRLGLSFGRYGDSPERNGIPAKNFAIVATDEETLQEGMARYEAQEVDLTIALDDTLCKGVESWAWYGHQPIHRLLKPGGTLVITSMLPPEQLLTMIHRREQPYRLAVVKGIPSFSGLWVYKDDHTDVRLLGAVARLLPGMFAFESLEAMILEEWKDPLKVTSARKVYETIAAREVAPGEGNPEVTYDFPELPKWHEMREGITIPNIPLGEAMVDPVTGETGGYRPARNPTFKKFTTRTLRPLVDFDKCIKCRLCWLQCPDSCFDVTPDGHYDMNAEACCGCGVCEAVCPVQGCITMVNEVLFEDNSSQWERWRRDPEGYRAWLQEKLARNPERMHGFRHLGQYREEIEKARQLLEAGD